MHDARSAIFDAYGCSTALPQTSAKSGLNIKALFKRIVQTLVELEGDKGGGQAGSQGDAGAATVITASQLSTAPAQGSRGSSCCS